MVSLNYVPVLNKMSMHDITKHELSLVMNYDISNYLVNLKGRVHTVMYVFSVSCKLRVRIINTLMAATHR